MPGRTASAKALRLERVLDLPGIVAAGRSGVASSLAENLEALELKQFSPFFGGQWC